MRGATRGGEFLIGVDISSIGGSSLDGSGGIFLMRAFLADERVEELGDLRREILRGIGGGGFEDRVSARRVLLLERRNFLEALRERLT